MFYSPCTWKVDDQLVGGLQSRTLTDEDGDCQRMDIVVALLLQVASLQER